MNKSTFMIQQSSPTCYRIVDTSLKQIEGQLDLKQLLVWVASMHSLGYGISWLNGIMPTVVFPPRALDGPADVPSQYASYHTKHLQPILDGLTRTDFLNHQFTNPNQL